MHIEAILIKYNKRSVKCQHFSLAVGLAETVWEEPHFKRQMAFKSVCWIVHKVILQYVSFLDQGNTYEASVFGCGDLQTSFSGKVFDLRNASTSSSSVRLALSWRHRRTKPSISLLYSPSFLLRWLSHQKMFGRVSLLCVSRSLTYGGWEESQQGQSCQTVCDPTYCWWGSQQSLIHPHRHCTHPQVTCDSLKESLTLKWSVENTFSK